MIINLSERAYQEWLDERFPLGNDGTTISRRELYPGNDSEDSRHAFYGGLFVRHQETTKKMQALQAKIDALMLEYCPQEMTEAQLAEWASHQRPVLDSRLNRKLTEPAAAPKGTP